MYSQQPPQPPQPPVTPTLWPVEGGPRRSGLAVVALICSLAGLIPCTFGIGPLLGVIFGAVGLVGISKSKGRKTGKGLAVAGLIIGIVGILWNISFWVTSSRAIYDMFANPIAEIDPVAEQYLKLTSEGKYDEAYAMTSPDFKMATSLDGFKRYNDDIRNRYGDYQGKEVNVLGGSNINISSTPTGTTAVIKYLVKYSKRDEVGRTLTFAKSDGKWLIEKDSIE
jgi:hypothetical protein